MNRAELESALDEVITNRRGIDFQRIAIPLARHRCPQIVANEVTKDGGADGFMATVSLDEKRVLAVGCSITASWRKIRDDLRTVKERNGELTAFWFYTAKVVTVELTDKWRECAKQEFGVSLTVFSREEIVQRLLEPQNQYLARLHLGITVPDTGGMDDTRVQLAQSAQDRINAWLRHHMDPHLQPVPREYWTGDEHGGIRRTVTVEELAETLVGGGLFLISGEGGLGKTIALGQIASELLKRENAPTPLLVSASSWARSNQPLVPFLAGQFLGAGDANSAVIQELMTRGLVSVFLNGWNEVPTEQQQRLGEGLIDAKLAAPGCSIVLASRSPTGESLGPVSRYNLSTLSDRARKALVEQLGPANAETVFHVSQQDAEVDALSRLPLFLVPLVDTIVRGETAPRHRHALLEAAITCIERMPDHSRVLSGSAMRTRYRPALSRLAIEMSLRGTTEAMRDDLASWLAGIADQDVPADQLLDTLIQHHVLVSEDGQVIRFQHPYFRDWFCAQHLRRLAASTGRGLYDTLAPLLDNRRLDSAWGLMVAALADEPLAAGIADQLFRIALDVDIRLAAEWVPILGSVVQRESLDELKSRLRRWIAQGSGAVELGLRSVLAARFDDFADEFWRRLESNDQHVVLSTYHMLEPFPIEVLGAEWRTRVSRWPPERRAEFAMEASAASTDDALRLAKDFASRDPSPMVRGKCLAHIAFYDSSAAERLFTGATEESVAELLEYGTLDFLSREAVNRHLPYIERLARTLPINHLGSCALSYLREIDPARVVEIYKQQISEERLDTHQQRAILEFIAQYDRQWVGRWVVKRLIAFDYLPEDFGQFLVDLDNEELVKAVEQILAKPDPIYRLATFLAPFLRLGRPWIVNSCLDELVGVGSARGASQQNLTEPERERLYELERGLGSTPLSTLVEVFAARRDTLTDAASARRAIDVLASSASIDPDCVPPASFASGLTLQTLARQLGVIVLSAEDPKGHEKAALVRLIGSTGYGELRDLLQELVAAESARVCQFFSNARQQAGGQRLGAYVSYEQWYVKAVSQAGGNDRISDLLKLFEDEVFELETGQELVRLAGLPFVSATNVIGSRTDWTAIAAEHRRVGERILSTDARDVASVVQRHLTAWSQRSEPPVTHGSKESRIASLEVMHARLTGHLRSEPLLALASNHHSVYTIERWLDMLVRCGITVPSAVADAALQTSLSRVNNTWHKPDEVVYIIKQLHIALMFSDNLELAAERIRSLRARVRPRWEMRDIVVPLVVSAVPQRVELLLEALPDSNNESYWYEWAQAIRLLPTGDQKKVAEALLTDLNWTNGRTQATLRGYGIMEVLVPVVQADETLRRTLKVAAFSESSAMRDFARHLLVAMSDPDSALVALEAALADPALRSLAEATIRRARWHPHPDHLRFPDHNAPQALTAVRRLLLDTAYRGDQSAREWARRLLVQVEAELEASYPIDEPRHPDLPSRLPWLFIGEEPASLR